jgi:hypothetical protein
MKKSDTIDHQGLEGILRRAALSAQNGSAQVRSGQIDEPMLRAQRLAGRLVREAQDAFQAWANWEAINSALGSNSELGEAIHHSEMTALGPVRMALIRDALRGAYRLSDPFDKKKGEHKDRITLCRLVDFLNFEDNRKRVSGKDWALDIGHRPLAADSAAGLNAERVAKLQSLILTVWGNTPPPNSEIYNLRTILKPVRDRILAHALDDSDIDHPTINQMQRFIALTLDLCTDMALLFVGSCVETESFKTFSHVQAENFWKLAFETPIAKLRDYEAKKLSILGDAAQ